MRPPPCIRPSAIGLALALLAGCTGEVVTTRASCVGPCGSSTAPSGPLQPGIATTSPAPAAPTATPAAQPSSAGPAPITGALSPSAPTGMSTAQAPAPVAPPIAAQAGGDIPCAQAPILSARCASCHSAIPKFGAPMALVKLSDFQAAAKSDPTRKVYELASTRLNAQDPKQRMPPVSSPALAMPELATLNVWLAAGAPGPAADEAGCDITEPVVPGTLPSTSQTAGAASGRVKPIEYNDPDLKCYRLTAHAAGDKTHPYMVGTDPDMYKAFTFVAPWKGTLYAKSFRPILDNTAVIHHWLLFKTTSPGKDLDVSDELGTHPDGSLLHGWAPGGDPLYLDPDVGEAVPDSAGYLLETHYNNVTGAPAPDMSGVEVCVTPKVPPKLASISWLGTDNINGTQAQGVCQPRGKQPIQLLSFIPHMHLAGRHMKVTINRRSGQSEVLHDSDFDFQSQLTYPATQMIMPGDTITTQCSYSEPKMFGRGTNEEMCYLFTLYYPSLALTNGDFVWSTLHGPDTCLN